MGVNYGLIFTAWGMGGVFGSMTAGAIVDATGSYTSAFMIAAVLCGIAALLSLVTRAPDTATNAVAAAQADADALL